MNPRNAKPLLFVVLVLGVISFPWVVSSNYWMNLTNLAISFSIACLGLNIVLGYTGQLSLGEWELTRRPSSPRDSACPSGPA